MYDYQIKVLFFPLLYLIGQHTYSLIGMINKRFQVVSLVLLVLSSVCAFAGNGAHSEKSVSASRFSLPPIEKEPLIEAVREAKDDQAKIESLSRLAEYYIEWEAKADVADSVLSVGIELAELSYDNDLLLHAYANYAIVMDDYAYSQKVTQVIEKLTAISGQLDDVYNKWKCKYALAKGNQLIFKIDAAKDQAYQALTAAIQLNNHEILIKSHLTLGDIHQKMNNNVEAINNYLDALTIADAEEDVPLRMLCYDHLSNFYNLIKAYDKSIQYKLKELTLAETEEAPDSIRIMTLKFDLEVIAFNNRTVNQKQLYFILDYAERNHVEKLKKFAMVAFRNHLTKQNDFAGLYQLFHTEFPEELEKIKQQDTTVYLRLTALFKEYEGDVDSALYYYNLAAARIGTSADKLRKSSFYLRYGDFFQRNNKTSDAIAQYVNAYALSSSISYYEYMLESSQKLETIYAQSDQFAQAYYYGHINRSISDSLDNLLKKEELQLLEIENEEKMREVQAEKAAEAIQRRNNIQYTAITILIATAFLLLLILGGFNVHPALIRMVGFICFIFFFEFLILLFDTWIHHLTHGEPWKILAIKILLMIGLVPLHHLVEKKVTHYLINKNFNWRNRLTAKKPKPDVAVEPVQPSEELED